MIHTFTHTSNTYIDDEFMEIGRYAYVQYYNFLMLEIL